MNILDELLDTARSAASAAAEVHRRSGRSDPSRWVEKGHADWVSDVDHAAERAAVEEVRRTFPEHAIAAEEASWGGPDPETAEVTWYIDPLDGTTNFLHGYPVYAASVAAADARGIAAAVVINSARWETFEAKRGEGARMDGHPISVSALQALDRSLIGTGFPFKRLELLESYLEQFRTVLPATSGVRRTGSAALDLCDVACGRLDGFWELHLMPWDVAAGILIVREAGGRVTDLEGQPAGLVEGGFIAGNPPISAAILDLVRGAAGDPRARGELSP